MLRYDIQVMSAASSISEAVLSNRNNAKMVIATTIIAAIIYSYYYCYCRFEHVLGLQG